ncbi:MAG: Beta-lactamase protein, partial [Acidobacteria bacterium]|nr:Beta-lactamase protein [Acidobacteriota bacterium]
MRTIKAVLVALLALAALGPSTEAQSSLPISLFERYVEALRQQAGIPGMSAAIVQNGRLVWDKGFGYQDVDGKVAAAADTPYPILDLTQTLSSTALLRQCLDLSYLELTDRVRRWDPQYSADNATVAQILSHASPSGGFNYDASRFAALTVVLEQCASYNYPRLLADAIFSRLGMSDSVPGADLLDSSSPNRRWFPSSLLDRYSAVVKRQAVPYRVDSRGRPTRSDSPSGTLSASTGVVSTVRDLARFDAALDDGVLLQSDTLSRAWEPVGSMPTGLGWFVQPYNGERVVWHFGLARDAYSSLVIKVPGRALTLILLANSDGLAGSSYN